MNVIHGPVISTISTKPKGPPLNTQLHIIMYNKHCKGKAACNKNQYVFNLIEAIKTVKEKTYPFQKKKRPPFLFANNA